MSEAELVVVGEIDRLKLYLQARLACQSFEIVEFADQIKLSSYEHRRDLELLVIVSGRADPQDGLDLVRAVRAQGSRAVIVLLTRYSSEARVMAAFKAGVNDYFKWPWDYPELLASIKHNLAIAPQGFAEQGRRVLSRRFFKPDYYRRERSNTADQGVYTQGCGNR